MNKYIDFDNLEFNDFDNLELIEANQDMPRISISLNEQANLTGSITTN